jgi:hypothetical protein
MCSMMVRKNLGEGDEYEKKDGKLVVNIGE